eukprot:TRINITY_DN55646_c0_g1_i1.p2 TRINITY_DN55646_c0_g1~~TRINITY_DN55646_c0_g1_i1.p2  ORF type:complete len:285 (+),score=121.73 TRINITY_DN55646_c0_g1_i1:75-857(+)
MAKRTAPAAAGGGAGEWLFMSDIRKVKTGGTAGRPNYDDLSAWTKYDDDVAEQLEDAYAKWYEASDGGDKKVSPDLDRVTVHCGKQAYVVEFNDADGAMRQYRTDNPELQRPVQRREAAAGGGTGSPKAASPARSPPRSAGKKRSAAAAKSPAKPDPEPVYKWMFMSDIRKVKAGGKAGKPNYDDMSAWTPYTDDIAAELEAAYKADPKGEVSFHFKKREYTVAFFDDDGAMRQWRNGAPEKQRPVQRRLVSGGAKKARK